jgi:hypothetical protein
MFTPIKFTHYLYSFLRIKFFPPIFSDVIAIFQKIFHVWIS